MDGQNPGPGQNGPQDYLHNFQFPHHQTPAFQFNNNAAENFNISPDMSYIPSNSLVIGTLPDPFPSSGFGGTQEAAGTVFGTGDAAGPWQESGAELRLDTASQVSDMAHLTTNFQRHTMQSLSQAHNPRPESCCSHSEVGSVRHGRIQITKQQHNPLPTNVAAAQQHSMQSPSQARNPRPESRYSRSETGSVRHGRIQKPRQRHNSRPANVAAAISIAGPSTVNDTRSIEAHSELDDSYLAENSTQLEDGSFQCRLCPEKRKPKCEMLKHIKAHIKPYICTYGTCTKSFATKSDQERHEDTHKDAKSLRRAFFCNHGKCSQKNKHWPRWDNLKTHLHDVHNIRDPLKGDYLKENSAAQSQILAGINGQFGTEAVTPASVDPLAVVEEFNTAETMTLGGQIAAFQFTGSGSFRTRQVIHDFNQVFEGNRGTGTVPRHQVTDHGQYLRSLNATPTPVEFPRPNSLLNNQPTYYNQRPSGHSTSLMGLPESIAANFQDQFGTHAHIPQGMQHLTTASRRGPRSLGQAAPLSPLQTTPSIHSYTSYNEAPYSHAGNTSSLTSYAVQSLPATGESHTMLKTTDVTEIPVDECSQDTVMDDAGADGDLSLDGLNAEYDLAGLTGVSTSISVRSGPHYPGNDSGEIETAMSMGTAEPGSSDSLDKSVIGDDSTSLDIDNVDDTRGDQSHSNAFISSQSLLVINPSDTLLSNSTDIDTDECIMEIEPLGAATPNRVETPKPAPPVDTNTVIAYFETCPDEDLKKIQKALTKAEADRNAGVEVLPSAPPPTNPQTAHPRATDAPQEESGSRIFPCTSSGCRKCFNSSSSLKKHVVRHIRPFGCTHGCTANNKPQTFGSKNDWKRHEESFHFDTDRPYMSWKCDRENPDRSACHEVFTTRDEFQSHLKEKHDEEPMSKKVAHERLSKCCLVTLEEAKYWCGFCKEIMRDMTDTPTSAGSATAAFPGPAMDSTNLPPNTIRYSHLLSSRFNHIDNHFSGRNRDVVTIDSWVSQEKHQRDIIAARPVAQPSEPNVVPTRTQDARDNRPATRPLRDRGRTSTTYSWFCCRCDETCSHMTTQCSGCNAPQCDGCRIIPSVASE